MDEKKPEPDQGTAKGRYSVLKGERDPYLTRARRNSELTIPTLIPPDGYDGTSQLYQPYQGLGARGVRNLASKLSLSLMPPNIPFMKTKATEAVLKDAESQGGPEQRAIVDRELSRYDTMVKELIDASGDRVAFDEANRHLIVAGNVAIDLTDEPARVFQLPSYVVVRSPRGKVIEAILHEEIAYAALDDDLQVILAVNGGDAKKYQPSDTINVYTWIKLKGKKYFVHQEVEDYADPKSRGTYPEGDLPYLFLRWSAISGDHYGRSFLDEIFGDLLSYETISQALVEGASVAATVKYGVNPNGTTKIDSVIKARNGGFFSGNEGDIWTLKVDKNADLAFVERVMQAIETRLEEQFMLNSSVQRDAERVTAEEIRYLAEELDASLSGIYTLMGMEFQRPYGLIKKKHYTKKNLIPRLPDDKVKYTVLTGLDALGRSTDLRKLDSMVQGLAELFGPEILAREMNVNNYIQRRASALGIDPEGLFKTQQQKAQEQEQAQLSGVIQGAAPGAIQEVIKQSGQAAAAQPGSPR